MERKHIVLLALLASTATRAQTEERTDSLLALLDSTRIDTVQMGLILQLQDAITGSEMAGPLNDRLGGLCTALMKSDDPAVRRAGERGNATYLVNEGNNLAYKLDLAGAVLLFREADAIGERLGMGETRESAMLGMAMVHSLAKNEEQATKACKAASDMAWARGDTLLVIRLAKRSMTPDDVPARDRGLALIDAYAASRPAAERTRILWQKTGLWARTRNYKEAIAAALASRTMLDAPEAPPYLAPAYYLTLGDCYRHADSLHRSAEAYKQCLDLGEAANAWSWSCSCGDSLGDVWLAIGDRKKAAIAYERVLRAAQANAFTGDVAYAAKALIGIYRDQGRETDAWAMQDIWTRARDSLDVTEGNVEIAAVEFRQQMLADSLQNVQQQEASERLLQQGRDQRNLLLLGGVLALVFGSFSYRQRRRTQKALKRSDELLLNILPEEVADELKLKGAAEARHYDQVTILFTDFKGFTAVSERLSPQELVKELDTCFSAFDRIVDRFGVEKIKVIGDSYMCAGGLPEPRNGSAHDVVRAALEMQTFMAAHRVEREAAGRPFFEMRVGIHTGPVVAGIVGAKKFQYDVWGDTVNTASRMESSGEVGQVNISEATYALVKDTVVSAQSPVLGPPSLTTDDQQLTTPAFIFTPRGKIQAKGKGEMEMYFVTA